MAVPSRYEADLGERDPLAAMGDSIDRIRAVVAPQPDAWFERSYAPGKWTARQIVVHLAQTELVFGNRVRMALTTAPYAAQPFSQERWVALESFVGGREALEAFVVLARMNLALFGTLSSEARAMPFMHVELGELPIDWIIRTSAGHQINHLKQLERIAAS